MSELRDRIEREVEKLKVHRDELRVQFDLGKMEAVDAWKEADKKWSDLESHLVRLKDEGAEIADGIGEAAEALITDLKDRFKEFRKRP